MKSLITAFTLSLGLAATTPARAVLFDRGGGLIYDDQLNITWLADANYAKSRMIWTTANAWAAGLSYFDSVRNVTYDDWRLPNMDINGDGVIEGCPSLTCPDNEYGYQFSSNGVTGATPSPFSNVMLAAPYWSGTEAKSPPSDAWFFDFTNGGAGTGDKDNLAEGSNYAWAVRPGDVAAVPEPSAFLLLVVGVGGLVLLRRARSVREQARRTCRSNSATRASN
jgi:hypothetical protein